MRMNMGNWVGLFAHQRNKSLFNVSTKCGKLMSALEWLSEVEKCSVR